MRFIDTSTFAPTPEWTSRAKHAEDECSATAEDARHEAIARRSAIWSDLKASLSRLSFGKCWYCESLDPRSDNNVDHFRPKGRVAECPDHPGYWWLAFRWANFRYCCTFCNSRRLSETTAGGKQDRFPLLDEATRVRTPHTSVLGEDAALLDPTKPGDPTLLWFEPDGSAVPKESNAGSRRHRRAVASIDHYHLNHPATKEQRQKTALRIEWLVHACDELFSLSDDIATDRTLNAHLAELQTFLKPEAAFSASARATLRNFRYREWVSALFNTI